MLVSSDNKSDGAVRKGSSTPVTVMLALVPSANSITFTAWMDQCSADTKVAEIYGRRRNYRRRARANVDMGGSVHLTQSASLLFLTPPQTKRLH